MKIKYLHTMIRITNIPESLHFFCDILGLEEVRRSENDTGKFTLIFLSPPNQSEVTIELTYNWDNSENYGEGRNFGHLAYEVSNIYEMCDKLIAAGVVINRPPRDGRMAFIRSPDNISIELLQAGKELDLIEPWISMPNIGHW